MYLVSSGPRPTKVFTAQANDSATEPIANKLTIVFDIRRPKRPLIRKPSSGRIGMSRSCCIYRPWSGCSQECEHGTHECVRHVSLCASGKCISIFHRADIINHQRLPVLEDR